jgi:soluble lytic murein transglycosylase
VPDSVDGHGWEQARLLARLGLPALAWELLRGAGGDAPEAWWVSAWLLDRAGAFHLSHDILRRKLWGFRWLATQGGTRTQWLVAFPKPFEALVDAAAKASGIDRHFLWAVMREESGFNPRVESWAKAVGLLQLLVGTGEQMRDKKADKDPITRERLQQPEVNIPLGARYLAHVKKYAKTQLALVPAGYNAGAGALNKWLTARGALDTDLFVELIPYEEARGYTKRVVSSWATYRALYGGEAFKNPIPYVSNKTRP